MPVTMMARKAVVSLDLVRRRYAMKVARMATPGEFIGGLSIASGTMAGAGRSIWMVPLTPLPLAFADHAVRHPERRSQRRVKTSRLKVITTIAAPSGGGPDRTGHQGLQKA